MTVDDYNKCVDEHADGLYRFMLKHVRDTEKARDLVQDAFTKVWLKVEEIDGAKAKSYLFSTGYHTMIDMFRRDKKQGSFDEVKPERMAHSDQYSDLNELLHQALETLPEVQKSVVLLRDYEGYSYEEIGEICSLTEAQVKVYIFRARKALKDYIGSIEAII
ncbi:RNA polymerase sigma factor [Cryomorpha ignava]|uniref:RNA polymerase sigma factor n=1 Tax=Cryomorpha ignava TaxID=101383 RepID=A0A7K3WR12_9FLAO|nr:RNA polymerase sigma factor [Cryomorpha ignava]NEN24117.1 RNA polymerase sigma factor [Cryomorpha ignava]